MNLIESGVHHLGLAVERLVPAGPLKDLIIDGVIGGVGGVIVFLPNILILFMGISFMEDTGYMARAAFIMDRVMHTLGLPEVVHPSSWVSVATYAISHPLARNRRTDTHHTHQSFRAVRRVCRCTSCSPGLFFTRTPER